ncbi:peroxisomal dehydratase [Phanerochaete sordida]|uniref:Peroxisomal dehydratase n=1 Tax=Phanerochaete sordida TaxID=48140 RepID=A0A9P3GGB8_9APHY|nr:peroxisomal dehydratase [Phanerochaete sordida]
MSQINLEKAIGHQEADFPVAWLKRDLLLYAVGIGAKATDQTLVNDKDWAPFPTYPVVLQFKGEDQDINDFRKRVGGSTAPGLPKFDPNRGVHGTQSIEILKPIPEVSGPGWKLKKRIVGVSENKSGIVVEAETLLVDAHGTVYAKLYGSSFNLGAKATGTKFAKRIAGPPPAKDIPKDRAPDHVVRDRTSPEQAAVYRLSGDYNALHIDPKIGQATGFGGVILHGLSTFGFAARAVLSAVGGGRPDSLRYFAVRFSSPVKPGDALETSIWEIGPGPIGTVEVAFVMKNLDSGKVCLSHGVAFVKKVEKSKL